MCRFIGTHKECEEFIKEHKPEVKVESPKVQPNFHSGQRVTFNGTKEDLVRIGIVKYDTYYFQDMKIESIVDDERRDRWKHFFDCDWYYVMINGEKFFLPSVLLSPLNIVEKPVSELPYTNEGVDKIVSAMIDKSIYLPTDDMKRFVRACVIAGINYMEGNNA
jgi:hypothetical protein